MQSIPGFYYANEIERNREFALAQTYFNENPAAVKYSRKDSHLKHSYLRNGTQLLALSRGKHGGFIGRGAFSSVKFAQNLQQEQFALKIQINKFINREETISKDVGLVVGNPITRGTKKYLPLIYIGPSLAIKLRDGHPSLAEKIHIARVLCWNVWKLHEGRLSTSKTKYTHCDIKATNIAINAKGDALLLDYGNSTLSPHRSIDNIPTTLHLPLTTDELNQWIAAGDETTTQSRTLEKKLIETAKSRLTRYNYTGLNIDVFSLKRTLFMPCDLDASYLCIFTPREYNSLPEALKQTMMTTDFDRNLYETNELIKLTLHFLAIEFNLDIDKIINLPQNQQINLCEFCMQSHDQNTIKILIHCLELSNKLNRILITFTLTYSLLDTIKDLLNVNICNLTQQEMIQVGSVIYQYSDFLENNHATILNSIEILQKLTLSHICDQYYKDEIKEVIDSRSQKQLLKTIASMNSSLTKYQFCHKELQKLDQLGIVYPDNLAAIYNNQQIETIDTIFEKIKKITPELNDCLDGLRRINSTRLSAQDLGVNQCLTKYKEAISHIFLSNNSQIIKNQLQTLSKEIKKIALDAEESENSNAVIACLVSIKILENSPFLSFRQRNQQRAHELEMALCNIPPDQRKHAFNEQAISSKLSPEINLEQAHTVIESLPSNMQLIIQQMTDASVLDQSSIKRELEDPMQDERRKKV